MEKIENLPLARIVTLQPAAAAVLEKYNLDFCCRGKQTLSTVFNGNEEKLKIIIAELDALFQSSKSDTTIDFNQMSLSNLVDYIIKTHHGFVRENSALIMSHLLKVAEKHGERHPSIVRIYELFNIMMLDLDQHMIKEEHILFPMIISLEGAYHNNDPQQGNAQLQHPILVMETEHEHVGKILDEIRKLTWNYSPPMDACMTFRLSFEELKKFEEDLHLHVHLENNILFPKALEMQKMFSGAIIN